MSKNVLIITYYWPPAGGPGVQRWLKFVKYLPEFDVNPIVYCPSNPNYPILDESLKNEIPKTINVIQQPIQEPYKFARVLSQSKTKSISSGLIPKKRKQSLLDCFLLFVRGNFFIPDARKAWVRPSVDFLKDYIEEYAIETIITTGPPHSLHLIGLELKHLKAVTWIADFRDPWTTIGYHKALKLMPYAKRRHDYLERKVLNSVDHLIVTSKHTKSEFSQKTKKPISVITNGYDTHGIQVDNKYSKFTVSHIGSLLSKRNPLVLWESISELINEYPDFKSRFELQLIGVVSDDIVTSLNTFGLKSYLKVKGYLPHKEAIEAQLKSHVLLLIEIDSEDTKAIIPGKLFEYLYSNTFILAIGPKGSDIEGILNETKAGNYFSYSEKEQIKKTLLKYFEDFSMGIFKEEETSNTIEQYSRKALTKRLSQILHDL